MFYCGSILCFDNLIVSGHKRVYFQVTSQPAFKLMNESINSKDFILSFATDKKQLRKD